MTARVALVARVAVALRTAAEETEKFVANPLGLPRSLYTVLRDTLAAGPPALPLALLAKEPEHQNSDRLFTIQLGLSSMMQKIRWGILILLIVVGLAIVLQNSEMVTLKLFWYETQLPTSTLLLVASAASFLLGAVTTHRMLRRHGHKRDAKPPASSSSSAEPPSPRSSPLSPTSSAESSSPGP